MDEIFQVLSSPTRSDDVYTTFDETFRKGFPYSCQETHVRYLNPSRGGDVDLRINPPEVAPITRASLYGKAISRSLLLNF